MKKIVEFTKIVQKIYKDYYQDDYADFLERLERTRDNHSLQNAGRNLFKIYNNKSKI